MSVGFRFSSTRKFKVSVATGIAILLMLGVVAMFGSKPHSALAAGTYSGTVFRDYNGNGVQDNHEPGIGGIVVTLYDSGNVVRGTATTFAFVCSSAGVPNAACTGALTPGLGSWSIASTGTGPYRVEFTNLPSYVKEGPYSGTATGNHTSVQFVNDGGGTVYFAVNDPGQFVSSPNPTLMTPRQLTGTFAGPSSGTGAVVSFPFTSTGVALPTSEVAFSQVGSTWGIAYSRGQNKVFVSAFEKRLTGFGPAATNPQGEIYAFTPGSGVATGFANIPNTGTNLHSDLVCGGGPGRDCDNAAFNRAGPFSPVGKSSLGALVISDDDSTLYTVNLNDRHLYSISVPGGVVTDVGLIPSPVCTNGVARPFGLGFHDGQLYMGGVCDASAGGTAANLLAYVYQWDPATPLASATSVITFPLNYARTCADRSGYVAPIPDCSATLDGTLGPSADWNPWTDAITTTVSPVTTMASDGTAYPMPMLTKIQFDNSDMILGFRDRHADMIGYNDPGPNNTNAMAPDLYEDLAGDVLRANPNGSGGWTLESNAASVPAGIFASAAGANTGEGPGGSCNPPIATGCGRFFLGDGGNSPEPGAPTHNQDYMSEGGLLQIPGFREVALTGVDPVNDFSNGEFQLSNVDGNTDGGFTADSGARVRSYQLYCTNLVGGINHDCSTPPASPAVLNTFGKANGLGDLVALFTPAPIEIGNRVWYDANGDGIQEPGEPGLSGINVNIYQNGLLVGTTTTDASGQYIFSATNVLSGALAGPQATALYQVSIPLTQTGLFTNGLNLVPTVAFNDGSPNGTLRDSNGISVTNNSVATVTTGLAGENDHSIDFGFHPPMDFGDLPDTGPGTGTGNYDTHVAKDGPRHILTGTLVLGACVTAEVDGQPNANATGDTCDDGITRNSSPNWAPGVVITLNVTVGGGIGGGNSGVVGGWLDWNHDGTFNDPGEFVNFGNLADGPHQVPVTIPGTYMAGSTVYARFRVFDPLNIPGGSLTSGLFTGVATGGEVEDYVWPFSPTAITLLTLSGHSGGESLLPVLALAIVAILGAVLMLVFMRRRRAI